MASEPGGKAAQQRTYLQRIQYLGTGYLPKMHGLMCQTIGGDAANAITKMHALEAACGGPR